MAYLGQTIYLALRQLHALIGCDTTSHILKVGKIKGLKKLLLR